MSSLHPDKVLDSPASELPFLAVCEHYAGNEKFLKKALELKEIHGAALDVTCDCEDGAQLGSLRKQVEMFLDVLTSERYKDHSVGLRLPHPGRGEWREELIRAMKTLRGRLTYLTLPKMKDARSVGRIVSIMQKIERRVRRREELPFHVLIEHPTALFEVRTIARLRRVRVLDFGIMDFVSSLGGALDFSTFRSPGQFENPLLRKAKTDLVLAATERGVVPSHNISLELKDANIVREEARRARREFGFRRMWSIHPIQIVPIIEEMQARPEELSLYREILLQARQANWAPIRYQDTLYDRASYRLLWWQLKQAKHLGAEIEVDF